MKLNNISTGILIICILCGIVTAATTISDTSISVDNLILGGQTIVAYTAALNTKLSGIETLADVTDATNVNAAGALMESDIPDQSFTNLLSNYDFESWSAGTNAAPDGWTLLAGATARVTSPKIGVYCNELTRNGVDAYMVYTITDINRIKSRAFTFGCWVKSSTSGIQTLGIHDGISNVYSVYHSGSGNWEWLTVTLTVDSSPTHLRVSVWRKTTDGSTCYDGAILVEGSVCPASSPKPIADDGIMLQAHTPSSASDYGLMGQWCYDDNYIYVCNNTDTWIRTSLTTW